MYKHLPSPVNFREDINGLRAWAVIAVLLFHFSLIGLPGGFVGVDIFFVISGYLMTAIVVGKLEKGSFSIIDFYMARVRRILPALLVVISTLLALGWFWLPTPDYQELGKQSAYSLAFLSNIGYWKSSGYFDVAAHEKWLLHTWSLAVEAQFYVLYPIIVSILWRYFKTMKVLIASLILLFTASFSLNIYFVESHPSLAFYFLPTRGWELFAGGLVFLLANRIVLQNKINSALYTMGWILLFYSFFIINQEIIWPGFWALLPVIGTSLIIFANNQSNKLTNNRIAQWIGDRSYSLYLWHWPLVVGLYFTALQAEWIWVIATFTLSLIIAHLSYEYIEVPTRSYLSRKSLQKEILAIGLAVSTLGIFSITIKQQFFEKRLNHNVETVASEVLNINPRREECHTQANGSDGSPACVFGNKTNIGALLIGDSHAVSSVNPISLAGEARNKSVMLWSFSACPTIKGVFSTEKRDDCINSTNWILEEIKSIPNNVPAIIINSSHYIGGIKEQIWFENANQTQPIKFKQEFIQNMVDTACEIAESRNTFLVRPYPKMEESVPQTLSRALIFQNKNIDIKIPISDYYTRNQLVWEAQNIAHRKCGIQILNPLPYLCDKNFCYGTKDGRPLYYDDNHLSEYGNTLLTPMFKEIF